MQAEHDECSKTLASKEELLASQVEQYLCVNALLEKAQSDLAAAEAERARDQDTIVELANQHSETVQQHEDELAAAQQRYEQLSAAHATLGAEIDRLQSELARTRLQRESLQAELQMHISEAERVRRLVEAQEAQMKATAQANADSVEQLTQKVRDSNRTLQ